MNFLLTLLVIIALTYGVGFILVLLVNAIEFIIYVFEKLKSKL